MQCNWNSHALLVGMQNGTLTLENNLTVIIKLTMYQYLPYDPAIPLPALNDKRKTT